MSNISTWFGWKTSNEVDDELPDIFPIAITAKDFIEIDVVNIFTKILTDVVERTHGLSDEQASLLWDNCLMSSTNDGIVSMLAYAMADRADLFLVYEPTINVVREATREEREIIKRDYETQAFSSTGVYVSFKNFARADIMRFYSGLEYETVASLSKSMNLSKAIQFKMKGMRGAVALADADDVRVQAKSIATALANGKNVMLDGDDEIVTSTPNLTSVKESISFLDSKRAFYLGLPESYINGVQTGGLGATGETDTKAVERGLRSFYFSVIKPVLEALFGVKLKYKTQDYRQITQALEALKTFEITDESLISQDVKKQIIESLLDIDASENETVDEPKPALQAAPLPPKQDARA